MRPNGGPFLLMAVLCQQAQQDQYGSLSVINVFEQLVVGSDDPKAPEEMPTFRFQGNLVVSLASGETRGSRMISIVPTQPDGSTLEPVNHRVRFRGGGERVTVVSNVSMDMTAQGTYWFDVLLDDRSLTRIPLGIRYERRSMQPWKSLTIEY